MKPFIIGLLQESEGSNVNLGGFECWRTSPVSLHVTSWEGIMYFIVQTKADAQKGGDEAIFGYDFFKKHI